MKERKVEKQLRKKEKKEEMKEEKKRDKGYLPGCMTRTAIKMEWDNGTPVS